MSADPAPTLRDRVEDAIRSSGLAIDPDALLAHVEARVDESERARAPLADLAWAFALGHGDPAAIARFESEALGRVADAVTRIDSDPAFATAVRDALRVRLLVGDLSPGASSAADRAPPRVLEYAGRGPFVHWVLVAAIRVGYDLKRRRGDREDPTPDLDAIWGDDPESSVVRRESRALLKGWLEEALRGLDDRRRAVIHLYFVEDVSSEAIARMYGVHRGTVARWVEEAKEAVRSAVRRRALATPGLGPEEIESMVRAADGHLSLSLSFLRG